MLSDLPNELILNILHHVDDHPSLAAFSRTCKRFHPLAQEVLSARARFARVSITRALLERQSLRPLCTKTSKVWRAEVCCLTCDLQSFYDNGQTLIENFLSKRQPVSLLLDLEKLPLLPIRGTEILRGLTPALRGITYLTLQLDDACLWLFEDAESPPYTLSRALADLIYPNDSLRSLKIIIFHKAFYVRQQGYTDGLNRLFQVFLSLQRTGLTSPKHAFGRSLAPHNRQNASNEPNALPVHLAVLRNSILRSGLQKVSLERKHSGLLRYPGPVLRYVQATRPYGKKGAFQTEQASFSPDDMHLHAIRKKSFPEDFLGYAPGTA